MAPSSSSSTSKKNSKTKKRKLKTEEENVAKRVAGIAAAYVEDIGMEGIKRKSSTSAAAAASSFWFSSGGGGGAATSNNTICKLRVDKEEENRRLQRMNRFGNVAPAKSQLSSLDDDDDPEQRLFKALSSSREKRQQQEQQGLAEPPALGPPKIHKIDISSQNGDNFKVLVGTSNALEKSYLRLTADPRPEDVRPLPVLRKALVNIKRQFVQSEDFDWANDQLKAVRQDLTVQHIRDPFVLDVYETHARILLEHGDLNEFNQCQTMIRSLTDPMEQQVHQQDQNRHHDQQQQQRRGLQAKEGSGSTVSLLLQQTKQSRDEFAAYGLLYSLVQDSSTDLVFSLSYFNSHTKHQHAKKKKSRGSTHGQGDCNNTTAVTSLIVDGSAFRHALQVVKAVIHHDYHTFFRLYECAPHMSAYLMDFLLRRVRQGAYERMVASYRPSICVEQVRETLIFTDLEETRKFLKKSGAVWVKEQGGGGPQSWVDCKASFTALSKGKK